MQSNVSHNGKLTAGTLEIGGDLIQKGGSANNFYTSGTHTVVLNGSEKQTVSVANNSISYSRINNLKIENTSEDGVAFSAPVFVVGELYNTETPITNSGNLYLSATTKFADNKWNYDANFREAVSLPADLSIEGSLIAYGNMTLLGDASVSGTVYCDYGTLNLNGNELTVNGDVWLSRSNNYAYLNVNKGKLYVNGDLNLCRADKDWSYSYLTMQNDEDYVLVNGDMYVNSYANGTLTAGTIELKGSFTHKSRYYADNFYASGTHKILLSGDSLQTISFANTTSRFNVVEITKPLETGYVFSNVTYNELTENYDVSTPPSAPWGLSFVRSTSTSIVMTWNESEGEKDIFCYEIYRDGNLVGTTTETEYIDNGLESHTKYQYYIVAKDVANNSSANSETITAYTNVDEYAPTTPTGIVAKMREDGSIYITWVASSDNVSVDGYNIYRSDEHIGTSVGNTYSDASAEPGYHEYYVEAFDNEGNTSLFSSSVFVDNMAPTKPVLSIDDVTSVSITFDWTSEDNVEIAEYKVYKNDELLKTTQETALTDTSIMAGNRYSYCVVAIDTSGNISETSEKLSVKAEEDGAEPVISSISCEGKTLSDGNNNISVLCTDDVLLSGFTAQVKATDSEDWTTVSEQSLSQSSQIVHFSVGEYISVSGEYNLKITITDAAGNDTVAEASFTYAANELTSPTITTEVDGCAITLKWTSASDETEVNYMVYKVNENGSVSYMGTTADTTCTFSDLKPLTEYSYYIKAQDENGNTVSSDTVLVSTEKDNVKPEAVAGNDIITLEGYAASFDGSLSSDNYDIKSYTWDFGDGITLDGETASHIYEEAGVYTVVLTVTDEYDNINTDEVIVTVYDDSYCIAEIQVLDENNNPISGATAYCELEGTEQTTYYGDKNGVIPLIAQSGEYAFYFYAKDYLPLKQSISLDGISINGDRQSVQLEKREIVTAEFAVEELEIEEIEELGIDVTAPENQHVCKVEMTIDNTNSESGEKFDVYVNQNGEFIDIEYNESITVKPKGITAVSSSTTSQGTTKTTTTTSTLRSGFGSGSNSIVINPSGSTSSNTPDFITLSTMVSMSVTEYSWMKDFFEISITFTNNASADFTIDNSIAKLVLPNGLSLADTDVIQTIVSEIGTIAGGTSKTVTWVIKGDTHGSYNASVNFEGQLNPFEIPVKATFTNDDPICVEGGEDTLKLVLDINSLGKADFTLTNASEDPVYNVQLNMDSYGEFDGAYMILVKYPSGMIEKITWNVDKTDTVRTVFLPVGESSDVDLFDFRTLGSQDSNEKITGMIFYQFDEVE